jgi:UDP-2,3-diacylglucosamine hydrolase
MLRNPEWQSEFLKKTPEERVQAALQAREMSAEHQAGVSMDIMDVNADAVKDALARHGVHHMIHGHTHRPAVHETDGHQRIVLGDWYDQGSVLTLSPGGLDLDALPYE